MNVTKLKALGKAALTARLNGNIKEWEKLIEQIDEESAYLRAKYPSNFWKDDDPKYKLKLKAWALKRRIQ